MASSQGYYALGTKIRLYKGNYKRIESLTLEDCVLGLDGEPKQITEIHMTVKANSTK